MARQTALRSRHTLDELLAGPPQYWLGLLILAAPWVRIQLGPLTLYPGHVALGALLLILLLAQSGWHEAVRPLAPFLVLGGYLAAVSALRQEWLAAALFAGLTGAHFAWGAVAMRIGMASGGTAALREALADLLGLSLLAGLAAWVAQAWWPPACRLLNCTEQALAPYPYTGGWGGAAQYLLLLLFLTAPLGGLLLASQRAPAPAGKAIGLPALLGCAGVALLAGAAWWTLALVALGWLLADRALAGRRGAERSLLRALAVAGAFAVVGVYGLEPGYLQNLWRGGAAPPPVRIALPGAPPRGLSSDAPAPLVLVLENTGWRTLRPDGASPLTLHTQYLVTPELGTTRALPGAVTTVQGALAPGEPRTVQLLVRVPPWVRDGYLTWELRAADGHRVPLASGSQPGFRFINAGYRRLALDPENQLTALAARARAFEHQTAPPSRAGVSPRGASSVLGDVLDTLVFSPLWGQAAGDGIPFSGSRAFLPALMHHYGLLGLAIVFWCGLRLLRRAMVCGDPGNPAWMLMPVAIVLLFAASLFTPAAATYHAHWAFFLLAGFLEGRYARAFPWPRLKVAPIRPQRLLGRLRIPLPRFRRHTGRR